MGSVSKTTMADTASTLDMMANTASTINLEPLMLDLPGYGYVLLILVLTWFLLFWQGNMVGRMRTKYKVEYPAMYSDTEPMFNCYQRVHQNTLERVTVFLTLLLAAGLFNPKMAAIFGFIWIISSYLLHWILFWQTQEQNCWLCTWSISWRDASSGDGLPTSWSVRQVVGHQANFLNSEK